MGAVELLGPAGPLARALPGYEARPGQLEVAASVERCLTRQGVALVEAGTGTGKTFAYLVPALLSAAHQKIVISTATRALQDQIFYKDLPLITRALGLSTPVAIMKGLPNYVCRRRYHEFRSSAEALEPRWQRPLGAVEAWLAESSSGAVGELAELPEQDAIWSRITASSERRIGASCRHFEACHVTAMKREAARARLVVVNHHLFFADLALRGAHPGSVLPDYDAVIFDEAHQIEDVATEHFGTTVSTARLARLSADAVTALERELGGAAADHARRIGELGEVFFDELGRAVRATDGRASLAPEAWAGAVESRWFELDTALEGLGARIATLSQRLTAQELEGTSEVLAALDRRASALREDLASIAQGRAGAVVWFEASGRARKVSASPVELSSVLQARLFDVVPSVVLTSATLSVGGSSPAGVAPAAVARAEALEHESTTVDGAQPEAPSSDDPDASQSRRAEHHGPFWFARQRLGLWGDVYPVEELQVPSPFRFEEQSLLYLPDDLPSPDEPSFPGAVAARTLQLLEGCDGGAFVLTTSLRAMRAVHADLEGRVGERLLLVQGEAPRAALIERFRAAQNAVLVATLGFWQGIDVPGAALRLVVLEKVPFPVPSDPILRARAQALEAAGASPFSELHLPLAQLALKQGFGRLIRHQSDYGVVALLDSRVRRRGYGRRLLAGLPPARRVTELEEVTRFWLERREDAAS